MTFHVKLGNAAIFNAENYISCSFPLFGDSPKTGMPRERHVSEVGYIILGPARRHNTAPPQAERGAASQEFAPLTAKHNNRLARESIVGYIWS
jgi:hypothetical protein